MGTPYLTNAWIFCIYLYEVSQVVLPSSSQILLLFCRSHTKKLLQPAQGAGRVFCAGGDLKMFYNKGKSGTNRSVS